VKAVGIHCRRKLAVAQQLFGCVGVCQRAHTSEDWAPRDLNRAIASQAKWVALGTSLPLNNLVEQSLSILLASHDNCVAERALFFVARTSELAQRFRHFLQRHFRPQRPFSITTLQASGGIGLTSNSVDITGRGSVIAATTWRQSVSCGCVAVFLQRLGAVEEKS
jgi:hypothetical protein